MGRIGVVSAVFLVVLAVAAPGWSAEDLKFRVEPDALAGVRLPVPEDERERKYLGVPAQGTFGFSDIKVKVVVVQVFSMYCPICQKDAERANELFEAIQRDPVLKDSVRMIGAGTGNTPYEVEVYRKKYHVKFPLVPDEEFQLKKASQDPVRTPTFLAVEVTGKKSPKIVHTHIGALGESHEMLTVLKKLTATTAKKAPMKRKPVHRALEQQGRETCFYGTVQPG